MPIVNRTPLWLARPSRFAALKRIQARIGLVLLALFLGATLTVLSSPSPPASHHDAAHRAEDQADVMLYRSIVDGVRHGGNYYAVTANALRTGDYPLKPFITFRLPTLAMVEAWVPPSAMVGLLYLLAAAVMAAWYVRLKPEFRQSRPLVIALILLAGGMAAFVQGDLVYFHEIWAGPLIALSLALRRPGRWIEAVCVGLIAMLIRETAVLYVGVMGFFALLEGERREFGGWCAVTAIFAVVVGLHAYAVFHVVGPLDPRSPGWAGMLGFGFFVKSMTVSTALLLAPAWIGALLVGFSLFGWSALDDPLGFRALGVFAAFAVLIGLFGRADTFYWALMVAPLILVGLAFAPDGLRDLVNGALDRRRITVTRGRL